MEFKQRTKKVRKKVWKGGRDMKDWSQIQRHYVPNFIRYIVQRLMEQTIIEVSQPIVQDPRYNGWRGVLRDTMTGQEYNIIIQQIKEADMTVEMAGNALESVEEHQ